MSKGEGKRLTSFGKTAQRQSQMTPMSMAR
jgi:hypothetical protein